MGKGVMKVFQFLFPILLVFSYYSHCVVAYGTYDGFTAGRKGLARKRIKHFEDLIRENEKRLKEAPELKVVKRGKPYITRFPIEDKDLASIDAKGDISRGGEAGSGAESVVDADAEKQDYGEGAVVSDLEDQLPSDIIDQSDVESRDISTADVADTNDSDLEVNRREFNATNQNLEDALENDLKIPQEVSAKTETDPAESRELAKKVENVVGDGFEVKAKEDSLKEMEDMKKTQKNIEESQKCEKKRSKLEKILKKKERMGKKTKKMIKSIPGIIKNNGKFCFSKSKKGKHAEPRDHDTLEDRLNDQDVVSEAAAEAQDELSTVASENEILDNMSSVSEFDHPESADVFVEKPRDVSIYSYGDDEDVLMKERALAVNETDFRTERMPSEEIIQDSDSEYLEIDEQSYDSLNKYKFTEESQDAISNEKAVKPLEGLEVEGISEGVDDDISAPSEVPVESNYSADQEEKNSDSEYISDYNSNVELSSDDQEIVGELNTEEKFSTKLSRMENDVSKKSNSFFGRIKSFFKNRKPSKNLSCNGSSCMKRLSKKDEPKFSEDFIPRIYMLSRNVPKENFYRVPEISSSLRSESNRLVFAYQLLDGSLIPSSALALSSKSFIVRRWGKKVQNKLTKLRQEFDNLKMRLSSMYHEGILKGEFELFIEEMDDLTIMLYLIAKEFPQKNKFISIARDILRYPEVVSTPGERLISMFRKSKISGLGKKKESSEPKPERNENDKLAIKALRKRMKFIRKRLNSLAK